MEHTVEKYETLRISSDIMKAGRVVKTRPEIVELLREKYLFNLNPAVLENVVEIEKENIDTAEYYDGSLTGKVSLKNSRLVKAPQEIFNALKNPPIKTEVEEEKELTQIEEPVVEPVVNAEEYQEEVSIEEPTPIEEKNEQKEISFDDLMANLNTIVNDNIQFKKQIETMKKELDKVKENNNVLKEEVKNYKKETELSNKKIVDLENENQTLERSLKALEEDRVRIQTKFEEELQAERLSKKTTEEFYEKKYREKEEKILKYLSAAISRGVDEEKETPSK